MWRKELCRFSFPAVVIIMILALSIDRAGAVLVKDMPTAVKQPDGRTVTVYVTGDEFEQYLHDANNFTIVTDPATGWYVYAKAGPHELEPTSCIAGEGDPLAFGLAPGVRPSEETITHQRQTRMKARSPKGKLGTGENGMLGAPQTGHINNLVIFIRFAGEPAITENWTTYDNMYNDDTAGANSLYNYLREVSLNQMTVTSILLPVSTTNMLSYQDNHVRGYYQPYNAVHNIFGYEGDEGHGRWMTLLHNAVDFVADEVPDDLDIDINGDGHIDSICFIHNGSSDDDYFWAYMSNMADANVSINGKRAWTYDSYPRGMIDNANHGVGVMAHEYLHILGAPDMYRAVGQGVSPLGEWDVMAGTANPPQHPNSWIKFHYIPWLSSINVKSAAGNCWLNPSTAATNSCQKIVSPFSSTQFLLVEYRRKTGPFESSIQASGMLVYKIDEGGENIFGPPDQVYLYRPGGSYTLVNGDITKAYFDKNAGRPVINDNTDPACRLSDYSPSGIAISQISAAGGSTMAYRLDFDTEPPAAPTNLVAFPVSSSEIDLTWEDNSNNEAGFVVVATNSAGDPPLVIAGGGGVNATSARITGLTAPDHTFYYMVYATNAIGVSPFSNIASATTYPEPPDAPANLQITDATENTMAMTWNDNSSNERGFRVERKKSGGTWAVIRNLAANTHSYVSTGLLAGTEYFFRIEAYNLGGESAYSNEDSASTDVHAGPPAAPSSFTAVPTGATTIRLTWQDNAGDEMVYHLYKQAGEFWLLFQILPADFTSLTVRGLTPNTSYSYRISAVNTYGETFAPSPATAVTLSLPAEYRFLVVDLDPLHLSGAALETAIEANGLIADRVTAMPAEIDPNVYLAVFTATGGLDGNHVLTGSEGQVLYDYLLESGRNLYLEGAYTFWYDPVRLDEPTVVHPCFGIEGDGNFGSGNLAGVEGKTGTFLAGVEGSFTQTVPYADHLAVAPGYTDAFSIWEASNSTNIHGIARLAPSYSTIGTSTQFGLLEEEERSYIMSKYLNFFLGSLGLPEAPANLTALVEGWSAVSLSWTDNSGDETGFLVERQDVSGGEWLQIASVPADTPAFRDTSMPPGTVSYRVCAFNTAGESIYSNVVEVTTSVPVPAAPSGLSAVAANSNLITLTWTDNADNESGLVIWRRVAPIKIWAEYATVARNSTSYQDENVYSEKTYDYKILAWNQTGNSAFSNTASAATPACDGIPHPPSWIKMPALVKPGANFTLSWTDNSPRQFYQLQDSTRANFADPAVYQLDEAQKVLSKSPAQPRYYFFRVRSGRYCDDATDYSSWSLIRHVTVMANGQTEPADFDESGTALDTTDMLILANFLAGSVTLPAAKSGDLNADGAANALDLIYIIHMLANHF